MGMKKGEKRKGKGGGKKGPKKGGSKFEAGCVRKRKKKWYI